MSRLHRYPVGMQVFEDIRTQGYLYVDKTAYIYDMVTRGGNYYFLSRPRRFGKTLLVSTMEAYFRGRRELFSGLAVDSLDNRDEWPCHPVLRFDFSSIRPTSVDDLVSDLSEMLSTYEDDFGLDHANASFSVRISRIVKAAHAQTGERVVILVDEYDAPLLNAIHDEQLLADVREVMRGFYAPFKSLEPFIRFMFLTGITKFSQMSIFSELNNLVNVSLLPEFAGVCGVTADELDRALPADVDVLSRKLGISMDACKARLKAAYDGYKFSRSDIDIYNPYSLISAFANGEIASYWFASGTPASLVSLLKSSGTDLPGLASIEVSSSVFDSAVEGADNIVAFMYQSGYLTIKSYDELLDSYTLGIPNREVEQGLYEVLLPSYTGGKADETSGFVTSFTRLLFRDNDLNGALGLLRAFLAGIPYDMAIKNEKSFQTVLYLIFKLVGAKVDSEVRTARGRIDVLLSLPSKVYVIELKYRSAGKSSPTAQDAIFQIDEKGYLDSYRGEAKEIIKAGVVFSEEERTIEEGWIVEDGK